MAEIDLIKISELPATSTIDDADELAVVQGGATKKVPYSVLKDGAEVTPDTTLSEAGVPADAAAVGAALAQKANQAAVTQALDAKADKTEVAGISGDIEELASVVERKADQTALNQKADKATTDALRQDLTTLNGIVNQKADKTELNAQIGNVTAELASKANTADVNNLLAAKANVASPAFTGRPQAPTAPKGTATLQLATTAFVQNAIDDKEDKLTFDQTPTQGSTKPVTSGGVWEAVETKADQAELAEVEAVTVVEVGTPTTRDILSELTWTEGWAMGTSGVLVEASTLRYSNKIAVSEGDKIELVRPGGTAEARFVCAFSGDTAVQAKGAENVTEYTVPEGIDSIVITAYLPASSYSPSAIYLTVLTYIKQNIYKNDIDALNTSVDAISEAVTVKDYTEESDRGETPVFTTGYMNNAGVIYAEGSAAYFEYSQKIAVQPGDVVSTLANGNSYPMRFVCAYNGDTVVSASGSSVETYTYTVPDGINGVVVTARKSTSIDTINVFHQEAAKSAYVKPTPMGYMMEQGALADGESMTLPYHNVKNSNVYIFNANIGTFSKIKFVKESSFYVEVDATNLIIVNDRNTYTIPHGLAIANNIMLMVCNETAAALSLVKVSSDGQEFSYTTAQRFLMDSGTPTILSTGSTLSDCTFSWVSKNINAPIWLFGDSYFSWYDNRWTYYLARDGYTKDCMLNGYAGEASAAAYDALKNLLSVTQPKIVVWCMGMNDGDSATEVNANWKTYYDKLINMSKKYGFEIVLYTVPTTSEINNTFKDAIIRESGYRYIEADKAVRIDSSGNWVPGALGADNVHPTVIGAKILYHRILTDLPEIMCNY